LQEKNKNILTGDKDFGDRLRTLRKEKGLSQTALAQKLGYKKGASISNIEKGKTPINTQVLAKIAHLLGIDLHFLITGNPSPGISEVLKELMPYIYDNQIKTLLKIGQLVRKREELQANGQDAARLRKVEGELEKLHRFSTSFFDTVSKIQKKYGV